jgi:transposase-like protein
MTSLAEAYRRWPDHAACIAHLEAVRWRGQPACTFCGSVNGISRHREPHKHRWQCSACRKSFSVTAGTIFHRTRVDLQRWFLLISLMLASENGLSSVHAARIIRIRQPTVWSMMRRVRKVMVGQRWLLDGVVGMDETHEQGRHYA